MYGFRKPFWAEKPDCRYGTVIATNKGWVVEETGEVLSSIKELDKKLKAFERIEKTLTKYNKIHIEEVFEEPKDPPKRKRGRPKKIKTEEELNKPKRPRGRPKKVKS